MTGSLLEKALRARWGSILRGSFEYNILSRFRTLAPRQLQINVTYRCNSRCTMCNIWQMREREEMDLEAFARVLEDPLFRSIERLTLAGGEPSLRSDLVPLTELFLRKMPRLMSVTLITNGLAVERILEDARGMLDLCAARGTHLNVSVSLDGVGRVHDEMRGVPGAFGQVERCLIGLKNLQRERPFWLGAACVIAHKNLFHLRQLQSWCAERGIDLGFQLVGFHETYIANIDQRGELGFDAGDREYLLGFLSELAAERGPSNFLSYYWNDMLHLYRDGRPRQTPCPFAWDAFVLDAYGDMYYCLSERSIGNCLVKDQVGGGLVPGEAEPSRRGLEDDSGDSCSEIYYSRQNLAFRKQLLHSACLRCNSACFVNLGIKKDLKKYLWFLATGK
jgi:MoaA/NifB/PqqE/SkfB family radical SAM enzyme